MRKNTKWATQCLVIQFLLLATTSGSSCLIPQKSSLNAILTKGLTLQEVEAAVQATSEAAILDRKGSYKRAYLTAAFHGKMVVATYFPDKLAEWRLVSWKLAKVDRKLNFTLLSEQEQYIEGLLKVRMPLEHAKTLLGTWAEAAGPSSVVFRTVFYSRRFPKCVIEIETGYSKGLQIVGWKVYKQSPYPLGLYVVTDHGLPFKTLGGVSSTAPTAKSATA